MTQDGRVAKRIQDYALAANFEVPGKVVQFLKELKCGNILENPNRTESLASPSTKMSAPRLLKLTEVIQELRKKSILYIDFI